MHNPYENPYPAVGTFEQAEASRRFLQRVYGWMFFGLALTALMAYYTVSEPGLLRAVVGNQAVFFGLIIGELVLVLVISAMIRRLSPAVASLLFIVYSLLNGLTLSVILLVYTQESIASAFLVCAAMFGALSLFGLTTRRSLDGLGAFCTMGLTGLVVAMLVSLFWRNNMLEFVINCVGIIVFTGLTAYDTRKLKQMSASVGAEGSVAQSAAILGALTLYLDFINLFLFILRFMGGRRD
ncbi:MAG: Bax inhibitor-1/YccA family protein [Acidobacteria bacterium]|nr:Bax inhibitor-1/YccA family protein [Acidobacteriota bacterium]